jgi:hypothetical protein
VQQENVYVYNDTSGWGSAAQTCYRSINGQTMSCSDFAFALAAGNQQIVLSGNYLNPYKSSGLHYTWINLMGAVAGSNTTGFVGIDYSGVY